MNILRYTSKAPPCFKGRYWLCYKKPIIQCILFINFENTVEMISKLLIIEPQGEEQGDKRPRAPRTPGRGRRGSGGCSRVNPSSARLSRKQAPPAC